MSASSRGKSIRSDWLGRRVVSILIHTGITNKMACLEAPPQCIANAYGLCYDETRDRAYRGDGHGLGDGR